MPSNPPPDATLFRPHFEQVLAIGRKVVAHRESATRPERQIVADADRLVAIGRHEEGLRHRHAARPCERHLADFRRRSQVSFGQRRRQREGIGVVVEPVPGDVGRQHRGRVDLDGQAGRGWRCDTRRGSGAAATGRPGFGCSRAQPGRVPSRAMSRDCSAAAFSGRGRPTGGIAPVRTLRITCSHGSAFFAHARQIQRAEREPARFQLLVVAGEAVLLQSSLMRPRAARGRGAGAWRCACALHVAR